LVQVELQVVRIDADRVGGIRRSVYRVSRNEPSGLAADEGGSTAEHVRPRRRIDHRVVDITDQSRNFLVFFHYAMLRGRRHIISYIDAARRYKKSCRSLVLLIESRPTRFKLTK